eukprot:9496465-Pyramimonas_sp.AAC.1
MAPTIAPRKDKINWLYVCISVVVMIVCGLVFPPFSPYWKIIGTFYSSGGGRGDVTFNLKTDAKYCCTESSLLTFLGKSTSIKDCQDYCVADIRCKGHLVADKTTAKCGYCKMDRCSSKPDTTVQNKLSSAKIFKVRRSDGGSNQPAPSNVPGKNQSYTTHLR